ncbi:hypothetical protein [Pseudomonas sp. 2FG]|uniref:hypothetical protein n=1 Tax=Pseudomonas sp. 2FG TaxID=2502191 RepID=UPI0010F6D5B4|nr:hypothetical protein [Pseudomonas sp. 2FG]
MRETLEEKLKEAFAKVGQELPARPLTIQSSGHKPERDGRHQQVENKPSWVKAPAGVTAEQAPVPRPRIAEKKKKAAKARPPLSSKRPNAAAQQMSVDLSVYRQGVNPRETRAVSTGPDSHYEISLGTDSAPSWDHSDGTSALELLELELTGQQVHPTPKEGVTAREDRALVLGLDFGSSSVKVVVGDSALEKAFAVPFRKAPGLPSFLLPCRLYKEGGAFSLEAGGRALADLKLAFLAHPSVVTYQRRVVAFLALVIRRARAWLFSEKEAVYRSSNIVWRMALGFPTANHLDPEQTKGFRLLGAAAWILAGSAEVKIDDIGVTAALHRAEALEAGEFPSEQEDVELSVIPEIAAQVYGYVASERFDHRAANNFMMVDVGAGTVDASLFHVKRGRGKWDFEFYTATVEPLGAVNLHRSRLNWWASAIQEQASDREDLLEAITVAKKVTDAEVGMPERLEAYFSAVAVKFSDPRQHSDQQFYAKVFKQVGHETYWKTSRGHLTREQLTDIPVYLCGGGSRMPFYGRLRETLNNHPSLYEWMRVKVRPLALPKRLEAPGLARNDFDRLSVAYGLSFLNLGQVLRSVPKSVIPVTISDAWRDNYVDK